MSDHFCQEAPTAPGSEENTSPVMNLHNSLVQWYLRCLYYLLRSPDASTNTRCLKPAIAKSHICSHHRAVENVEATTEKRIDSRSRYPHYSHDFMLSNREKWVQG
jgi:hypothetical protein